MASELERLKAMIADDTLHHATYRNRGTLWEGIWFYRKSNGHLSFQGYEVAGCVNKCDPDYEAAYEVLAGKGIHVGAYGGG